MTFNSGVKVNSITDWNDRRKELFETAVNLQYGDVLPNPEFLELKLVEKKNQFPLQCVCFYLAEKKKHLL